VLPFGTTVLVAAVWKRKKIGESEELVNLQATTGSVTIWAMYVGVLRTML
jgi:hypothetical protein